MSVKPFETFLVEQFLGKAGTVIEAGFRYQFKSPDSENSIRLYQALIALKAGDISSDHGVLLPYLQLGNCKVVPVIQSEQPHESMGFTENYISLLRDEVAGQEGFLKGCALLIIHNSLLDTVINSAEDLSQPGQVWNTEEIKRALKGLIDQQDTGRGVSQCLLDDQFDAILEDGATMFGFEALYNAVRDGDLRFNELGMLNDPQIVLYEGQPAQLRRRLAENRALYEELSFEVEHFGDQLEDRLKSFGEKFIREHFSETDSWKNVDFQRYLDEMKRNSTQQLILEDEQGIKGMTVIARNKSESKAGMRDRHIIIELDNEVNEYELKFNFAGANNLDKSQFSLKPAKGIKVDYLISARNNPLHGCSATLKATYAHEPQFFNLQLKRENKSEVYNFRCLVVRKGEFYIEPIKNLFLIEPAKMRLTLNMDENKLQIIEGGTKALSLFDAKQVVNKAEYGLVDFEALANESDEIDFIVQSGENQLCFNVEGAVATDSLTIPLLLNRGRYHKLFKNDYNGELLYQKGKVSLDNSEFVVPGLRLKLLRWEQDFVDNRIVAQLDSKPIELSQLLAVDDNIHSAYQDLFEYLSTHNTIPSLVSWGVDFTAIVSRLVDAYLRFFEAIPTGGMLSSAQKLAIKIGNIAVDGEEYYSPFHPLLLAYNLYLSQTMQRDSSFESLPDVTFERLSATGLLPYVYHPLYGFAYNQRVRENAFWLRSVPQEKSALTFVRKLVKEKLDEFQLAFTQLFSGNDNSILVNAVNQDAANELFLGLVDYIRTNMDKSAAIHVNLYDDDLSFNAFDRFAETANYDELKEWLELNKGKARETADTVIDLLRTRLTYSKFTNAQGDSAGQAYAHLTFFRNNNKVDCTSIAIDSMVSGIACDGLLAGEASKSDNGSYLTGFGLQGVEYSDLPHLKMAKYIGSLIKPALQPNTPYQGTDAVVIAVNEDFKTLLKRSYESSIWTTIIDPKVTLDFFHSNEDVVLIHYSDQYTSSASYDAITVTAQTQLFERVIQQGDGGRLNEFNAFNGDWLLKMMTCTPKVSKERKGIIGAYKFIVSLLHQSDITWVPLSVGEMIRVAGNIGLKISESDFSCRLNGYVKGAISDDVLLVGFKAQQIYLLPLEVKTGATPNYQKAVAQAKELLRYMSADILGKSTVAGKLHRGLFMRQVLMQIDKYRLYNVFNPGYFDGLLAEKEQWLKGDYALACIANYPAGFVVSHLESDAVFEPDYQLVDGILRIDLPMAILKTLVETPLQQLLTTTDIAKLCHVPTKYMLTRDYSGVPIDTIEDETEVPSAGDKSTLPNVNTDETENIDKKTQQESEPTISTQRLNTATSGHLSVLFGHNATTEAPLNWEPTNTAKFMNTNTGIIGTMGTGKTQFTKSVITQLHRNQADNVNGAPIGMLIFDYKSDYVDDKFIDATQAKKYKLHKLPYNPLSLYGDTPMLPVHTARGFSETMGKAFNLGQKQQLRLRKLVGEAYELAGINKSDTSTWNKLAPTIADVWELFIETEPDEDSLYAALESLYELEIFEDDNSQCMSLYDLVSGITVVELAGYPSEVQNLVVALTLDLFYSQMQKHGKPEVVGDFRQITKLVLVDEADNFMSQNFPSLRKILKEGREYGVGVVLSTQDITHFQTGENDYSSYVMTWVVHRVAKIKPQDIKAIFSVNEKSEQERLMETINKLEKHNSLYIDGAKKLQKMRDRAFWELVK